MAPRFSVVIPTRDRAQTLRASLRTCLDQDFEDYEVIVCDNYSSPDTRRVVEEFNSPRLRYVRASEPLAMSRNWELALEHATGEFVTVLGDDDGLLSHALRELDRLITCHGARVVRWDSAFYLWPTIALEGEANFLSVPLGRELHLVEAVPAIAAVINFRQPYTTLPMIYNAVIHRDLVAELRVRTGRVFANYCPDVYSGFAFAYLAGNYLSVGAPMTVSGLSGHSTGVATLLMRRPSDVARDFRQLNAGAGLTTHPWVPDLPLFPEVPIADSFQFARELLFPDDDRLRLNRQRLVAQCIASLWAADPEEWQTRLGTIRATLADDSALQKWFDEHHAREPFRVTPMTRLRPPVLGFDGSSLHLRTDTLGVTDVAGAAQLCEKILAFRGRELEYGKDTDRETVRRLESQLEVSETDRAKRLEMINQLCGQLTATQGELKTVSEHYLRLQEQFTICEADRAVRLENIITLHRELKASEACRTAALQAFQAAGQETIRGLTEELAAGHVIVNGLTEELVALRRNTLSRRLKRLPRRLLALLRRAKAS